MKATTAKWLIIIQVALTILFLVVLIAAGDIKQALTIFAYIIGGLTFVGSVLGSMGIGAWWSERLMAKGANIALQAQASDDKRDIAQLTAFTGALKKMLGTQSDGPQAHLVQPPMLAAPQKPDFFVIDGIEDDYRGD